MNINSKKTSKQTTTNKKPVQLQTVVVSGLRQSLQSAESIKRNSRMIVDAVVAQNIGKLPDNSVADALQRVTGVQVAQGFQGATTGVVIRGLPDIATTINGREMFSGGGRALAFQNIAATAVKSLKVYKTSNASLIDGGIAGMVNIELWRPFDFKGRKIAFTLTETHSHYGGHTDPNTSLLLSNRWQTGAGEFGALIDLSYRQLHYDYNAVWGDFPKLLTNGSGTPIHTSDEHLIAAPNGFGADYNIGHRKRPQFNYALQWKPNENTMVYLEGIYDYDSDNYDQPFFFSFPTGLVAPTDLKVTNNCYANQLPGPHFGQTICDAASGTWAGQTYAASSTQAHKEWGHDIQNAIGAKWHNGRLSLSTDLSREGTSFEVNTFIVDTFLKGPLTTVWRGTEGQHQNWNLVGHPATNAANFYLNGLFQDWGVQKGKATQWRGDGTFDLNGNFFQSLQFGLRYSTHTSLFRGSFDISTPPPGGPGFGNITADPNPANQVIKRFPQGYFCAMPATSALPTHWLTGCYSFLRGHKQEIRKLYGLSTGLPEENPGRFFNINEKRYAGYMQVSYGNELFGLPYSGLIGMRVEKLNRNLDAFSFNTATGIYTPLSKKSNGVSYLPNISFNLNLTQDVLMRLDASKTITYPAFGSLNPSLSLNPGTINRAGTAAAGNPDLPPMKSNNFDASLGWYFSSAGYLATELFYRDDKGFISNRTRDVTINDEPFQLTEPEAAGKGHFSGAGVAYQQFFSFLPGALNGLGMQINYTRINGTGSNFSTNNGNAILMYEKYGWSARLAYNYRSRYVNAFNQPTVAGTLNEIKPANQLDLSVSYEFNPHVTVVFNATNLTHQVLHEYWGNGTTRPRDIRFQDYSYGLGIRLHM